MWVEYIPLRSHMFTVLFIMSCYTTALLFGPKYAFFRRCTSSLCAADRDLQGSRVIPDQQVAAWVVYASPLNTCWTGGTQETMVSIYWGGRLTELPGHSATNERLSYFKRMLVKRKFDVLPLVRCRWVSKFGSTVFIISHRKRVSSLIRVPETHPVGYNAILVPGWQSDRERYFFSKE